MIKIPWERDGRGGYKFESKLVRKLLKKKRQGKCLTARLEYDTTSPKQAYKAADGVTSKTVWKHTKGWWILE